MSDRDVCILVMIEIILMGVGCLCAIFGSFWGGLIIGLILPAIVRGGMELYCRFVRHRIRKQDAKDRSKPVA